MAEVSRNNPSLDYEQFLLLASGAGTRKNGRGKSGFLSESRFRAAIFPPCARLTKRRKKDCSFRSLRNCGLFEVRSSDIGGRRHGSEKRQINDLN